MSEETFDNLIKQLAAEDYDEKVAVIKALVELNDPRAINPIIDIFKDDENDYLIIYMAPYLTKFGNAAIDILIKRLREDENPIMRANSARLLRELMAGEAVESLIEALKDTDAGVRLWSAYALYFLWDYRAALPLIPLLKDSDIRVRRQATWSIGAFRKPEVVKPLIEALKDEELEVRKAAADSLAQLGYKRVVIPLINLLNDDDKWIRYSAIEGLGKTGGKRAIEPLINRLESENDNWVKDVIVHTLGELKDVRAVESLSRLINNPDRNLSKATTIALGKIGPVSIPYLIEAFKTSRWEVCQRIATNLSHMGEPALQALLEDLKDKDSNVRFWSCVALGRLGDSRALPELEKLAQDDEGQNSHGKKVKRAAQEAIEKINSKLASKEEKNLKQG